MTQTPPEKQVKVMKNQFTKKKGTQQTSNSWKDVQLLVKLEESKWKLYWDTASYLEHW